MREQSRRGGPTIDAKRAAALLYPMAAFLRTGGLARKDALDAFSAALDKVARASIGRRMEHIGHPTLYADVVAVWARDRRYLDRRGRPRPLQFGGSCGFASLVRSTSRAADPKAVLGVLRRYGNVRRATDGRYRLTQPFFHASAQKSMAYEPLAYFLGDASSTLSRILRRPRLWRGPDLFWQKAERARISESTARRFTAYAKERCLLFLDEMDDWLEAHSDNEGRSMKTPAHRRIGIGIFSIYSERERAP